MKPAIVPAGALFCLILAVPLQAEILHVPADHALIQGAIDAAQDGDLILVDPGTYVENIDFMGKAVAVKSTAGPEVTVIDGGAPSDPEQGSTVTFRNGEGSGSVLQGFTITNGSGNGFGAYGGGVFCDHASPVILGNRIENNHAVDFGGGICLFASSAVVEGNTVTGNTAEHSGGGLYLSGGNPKIRYNTISGNTVLSSPGFGGGLLCEDGSAVVAYNRFQDNLATAGGGAAFRHADGVTFMNDLFSGNAALFAGGGIYLYQSSLKSTYLTASENSSTTSGGGIYLQECASVEIGNSIFWGDTASWSGPEIHLEGTTTLTITYSDVEGGETGVSKSSEAVLNWGDGMIEEDPLFVGPGLGDFHLAQDPCQPGVVNPAVDTGDPSAPPLLGTTRTDGIKDDGTADMGYHYTLEYFLVPEMLPFPQDAVGVAAEGTAVLVAPGTYTGTLDFLGRNLTVRSDVDRDPSTVDEDPVHTVLDGQGSGPVVRFDKGERSEAVLEGFTVTNGSAPAGGGILCRGASPVLRNNIVTGNQADQGAGLACEDAAPAVRNNAFSGNTAVNYGGGIYGYETDLLLEGNRILENSTGTGGGGGLALLQGVLSAGANLFHGNTGGFGGGLYLENTAAVLSKISFHGNSAGAGGALFMVLGSSAEVRNAVFWKDEAVIGKEVHLGDGGGLSSLDVDYSLMEDGQSSIDLDPGCTLLYGPVMLEADPLFQDPGAGDLHLTRTSPCINRGVNAGTPPLDPDGDPVPVQGTADMGADEYADPLLLEADLFILYEGSAGQVHLALDAGAEHGNRPYLVLGSVTGTVPGTPLSGGEAVLPLNWDFFTTLVSRYLNTPVFQGFLGNLDPAGKAAAVFDTLGPLPGGTAGTTLYFAYVLGNPFDFVSNPVAVEVLPP